MGWGGFCYEDEMLNVFRIVFSSAFLKTNRFKVCKHKEECRKPESNHNLPNILSNINTMSLGRKCYKPGTGKPLFT